MKQFLVVISLLISISASASHDTLMFKGGFVLPCEISDVKRNVIIVYTKNTVSTYQLDRVDFYKKKTVWYNADGTMIHEAWKAPTARDKDPCYTEITKDDFVHDTLVVVKEFILGSSLQPMNHSRKPLPNMIRMSINYNNRIPIVSIKAETGLVQKIELNQVVYFKFSNDSIIKISNEKITKGIRIKGDSGGKCDNCSVFISIAICTKNADVLLNYCLTHTLVKIRCGVTDYDVSAANYTDLLAHLNCANEKISQK